MSSGVAAMCSSASGRSLRPQRVSLLQRRQQACSLQLPRGSFRPHSRQLAILPRAQRQPDRSYDGDDELDDELGAEFDRYSNPDKFRQLAKHLDLMWRISGAAQGRGGRPEPCDACRGSGETECSFCHGTGSMTIGDTLYCSETGCASCPVCKSSGCVRCQGCTGTGFRASWLGPASSAT